MPTPTEAPPAREGAVSLWVRAFLVVTLSAVGLAACSSNNPTSAPASVPPSALPARAASVTPAATAPAPPRASRAPAGSAAPSSGGTGVDACALLPSAALSKIVGGDVPVANAMPSGGWMAGQCAWNSPTSSFIVSIGTATSIAKFGDPAAPDAKAKLTAFKQHASAAGTPKDVAGIGDGAVLGTSGMAAYVGGTYFEVTPLRLTGDQLIEIVKLVVAHL
jgi:hypothetical protein